MITERLRAILERRRERQRALESARRTALYLVLGGTVTVPKR